MLTYETIIRKGLVNPSVADILIGDDDNDRILNLNKTGVNRLAYNVCLFYSVLIQAYYISLAIDSGTDIYHFKDTANISDIIKNLWINENKLDFTNEGSVFSFIIECSKKCPPSVIKNGEELISLISYLRTILNQGRHNDTLDDEDLIQLLDSFELLKKCQVKRSANILTFETPSGKILRTSTTPYLFFVKRKNNAGRRPYVFVSAIRGERNQEIVAKAVELNSRDKKPRLYTKRLNISDREDMRAICRAMGIDTNWYTVDDCWCDLAFLKRVLNVTESVLKSFWNLGTRKKQIQMKLKELYRDSDLYDKIDASVPIYQDEIENFLYQFFITNGVFKSMYGLFLDMSDNKYSAKLYSLFKDILVKENFISEEDLQKLDIQCKNKIEEHLNRLRRMIPEDTLRYKKRDREIKAEWRSFTILRAAGIHTDNLFADREKFLSIDDHFRILSYSGATVKSDLQAVLRFLISFYEPLIKNSVNLDELKLIDDIKSSQESLEDKELFALFDHFARVVRESVASPISDKLLGRPMGICDPDVILDFKSDMERYLALEAPEITEIPLHERYVFVSYSHKDQNVVRGFVNEWKACDINVYFDEDKFKGGDNWREKAKREICSPNCAGIYAFFSKDAFVSEAVWYELNIAKENNKPIVFINLEDKPIYDYLYDMIFRSKQSDHQHESMYPSRFDNKFDFKNTIFYWKKDKSTIIEKIKDSLTNEPVQTESPPTRTFSKFENCVARFYAYLKTGNNEDYLSEEQLSDSFESLSSISHCVYPLVVSVKETKIKRDNITIIGYEIINSHQSSKYNFILSSRKLPADDYYCIPNYRTAGDDCSWMVEPLLIRCRIFHNSN